MTKAGESKMVERHTTPQARLNTRALEIAADAKAEITAHKDMDALQFANIRTELTEIKGDIKELGHDAKLAISEVSDRQDANHKDNQSWMRRLEEKVDSLGGKQISDDGKREGARWLGLAIKDWVIVGLALATVIFNFTHAH